jgi:dTDP-4-dehydrorhamnose 3,5-epimerase
MGLIFMKIITTAIEGILIIEPNIFMDRRGFFLETYNQKRYNAAGIITTFVQDNLSYSLKNTLRGLHFQIKHPQAKLIQVISGEIFDVAVDLRSGSATFGKWTGIHLSDENRRQVFIPEGFAHGFCVLSESALFHYKCSDFYAPDDEGGIIWSDPDIGIEWPVENPIVSEKDNQYQKLSDLTAEQLPSFNNKSTL